MRGVHEEEGGGWRRSKASRIFLLRKHTYWLDGNAILAHFSEIRKILHCDGHIATINTRTKDFKDRRSWWEKSGLNW